MKEWMTNNKGLSIVMVIIMVALLLAVVAGPTIWSAILVAHGF